MALVLWPEALPRLFLLAGYSETVPDGLLRSENDAGPAKVRRRSSASIWEASGAMSMSAAQYAAFRAFLDDDLGGGALPFEFPDQRAPTGYWLARIRPDSVEASRVGPRWRVSFKVEVLP
jgi:hypothetical protein